MASGCPHENSGVVRPKMTFMNEPRNCGGCPPSVCATFAQSFHNALKRSSSWTAPRSSYDHSHAGPYSDQQRASSSSMRPMCLSMVGCKGEGKVASSPAFRFLQLHPRKVACSSELGMQMRQGRRISSSSSGLMLGHSFKASSNMPIPHLKPSSYSLTTKPKAANQAAHLYTTSCQHLHSYTSPVIVTIVRWMTKRQRFFQLNLRKPSNSASQKSEE